MNLKPRQSPKTRPHRFNGVACARRVSRALWRSSQKRQSRAVSQRPGPAAHPRGDLAAREKVRRSDRSERRRSSPRASPQARVWVGCALSSAVFFYHFCNDEDRLLPFSRQNCKRKNKNFKSSEPLFRSLCKSNPPKAGGDDEFFHTSHSSFGSRDSPW